MRKLTNTANNISCNNNIYANDFYVEAHLSRNID